MATVTDVSWEPIEDRIAAVRAQLLETDEVPLETPWHCAEINLLIEVLRWHWRDRTDFYVGGNMFVYYSLTQAKERKYRGPDFFFVDQVDGTRKREFWWVFEEDNRLPDLIIELSSPSTIKEDLTAKKEIYEKEFKTAEYICYDPIEKVLRGWRLSERGYLPIEANEKGWLWSEQLGLWVGAWEERYLDMQETWLRYYDTFGQLVNCQSESLEAKAESLAAKAESLAVKASAAEARADALAAELAHLKAQLAAKDSAKDNGQS